VEFIPAILARTIASCQIPLWKQELAVAYTQPRDLLTDLGLEPELPQSARAAFTDFPFLVPRGYAAQMTRGDSQDPLLRQVLPTEAELITSPGYSTDPVGDAQAMCAPGLLEKYRGRALLVVTGACAIHCRYCFRRHFSYSEGALVHDRSLAALQTISSRQDITEIILSGGDPLLYDDRRLADLVERLSSIRHLRRLRLHTRLPIVLPSRVTPQLCAILNGSRLKTLVVVHANHAQELGEEVRAALAVLQQANIPLLNQSVLLRGVNDNAQSLAKLSEALFECGVLPYYLHFLDPVAGASHFEVPIADALTLMEALRTQLPGYLVPRAVRETPSASFKQPLC